MENDIKRKGLAFVILLVLACFNVHAQGPGGGGGGGTMSGSGSVFVNTSGTYTITPDPGSGTITNATWSITGGIGNVTNASNTQATGNWTSTGSGTIRAFVTFSNDPSNDYIVFKSVTVSAVPPSTPNANLAVVTANCGNSVLTFTPPSLPSGVSWYWQSSTSGTSTASGSGFTVSSTGSYTYYLRAYDSSTQLWSSSSAGVPVTVYSDLTAGAISGIQTICYAGDPVTMGSSTNASGCYGTLAYQWQISTNNSSWSNISGATSNSYNPPAGLTSSRWYRRKVSTQGTDKYTSSIKVTVLPVLTAGTINGAQTVCYSGDPGILGNATSPANGLNGYTYQWQISTDNSNFSNIGGATSNTYNPPSGLTANRWYRRQVTSCGQTKESSSIKVTVLPALTAGSINGAQTVCYNGDPITLGSASSPANGQGGYIYQWQYSANGSSGWTNIGGAVSSTYNPPGSLTVNRWYRRQVQSCGQTKETTAVKVTVLAPLNAGVINGAETICYNGDPGILGNTTSPSNSTEGYSYQWQYSNNGSSGWTNISGATSSTYNPPSGLTANRWYRRQVSSCGQTSETTAVMITVLPALTPGAINNAHTVCYNGNPATLGNAALPTNGLSGYAYQWQYSADGSSGWTNISGATSNTYDPPAGLTVSRWYRRRVQSCAQTNYTTSVKVTTLPALTAGAINGTQTVCYNGDPSTLGNATSPTNGLSGYTYQWQISTNNSSWSNISGATSSTYNPPGGMTADRWYRRQVTSCGQTKESSSIKVTVLAQLVAGSIGGAQTICANQLPATLTNVSNATGGNTITYQWQSSPNGSSNWTNVGTGATYAPGTLSADTWYQRIATTCGTSLPSNIVKVTVNQLVGAVSISGDSSDKCQGDNPVDFNATASNGTNYNWSLTPAAGTINSSGTVTWNPGFHGTATISVTASGAGSCNTTVDNVTVTVHPTVSQVSISGNTSDRCEGSGTTSLTATASNATGYNWTISTTPSSSTTIGSTTGVINWDSNFHGTANISVTASGAGNCNTTNASTTITVNPQIGLLTITGDDSNKCKGSSPTAFTANSSDATNYNWSISPSQAGNMTFSGTYGEIATVAWDAEYQGPVSVSVTASGPGNCTALTESVALTIYDELLPGSITTANTTICENVLPSGITNSSSASGGTNLSYQWYSSNTGTGNWTAIGGNTASYVPGSLSQNTWYKRTAVSSCGSIDSNIIQVTVNPVIGNLTVSGGATDVCQGANPIAFTASASDATNYAWVITSGQGTITASGTANGTGTISFPPTYHGQTTIQVTASAPGNCNPQVQTVTVTVHPTIGQVAITGASDRCEGSGTMALTATAANATNYSWTISTTPSSSTSINSSTGLITWDANFQGTANVSVVASKPGSCNTTNASTSITVNPTIEAVTITGDNAARCQGAGFTNFDATAVNASTYAWSVSPTNAGTINTANGDIVWDTNFHGTATISVVASGAGNCNTTTDDITVVVYPTVGDVTITGGLSARWPGSNTTDFNASASNASSYSWSIIPVSAGSINSSGIVSWNADFIGDATITVTASGNCNTTTTSHTVNTSEASIELVGSTIIDSGDELLLTADGTYDTYTWKKGTSTVGSASTYAATTTGSYTLTVTKSSISGSYTTAPITVSAPSGFDPGDENYVMSTTVLTDSVFDQSDIDTLTSNNRSISIQYADGLGRGVQVVGYEAAPDKSNIVQSMTYDKYGRQTKSYLPYVVTDNAGLFQHNPLGTSVSGYSVSPQYQFYQSTSDVAHDIAPYAQSILENSPLGRTLKQGAPGATWQPVEGSTTDKVVRMAYEVNGASEVRFYEMVANSPASINPSGYYGASQLSKSVTEDEEGNQVIQYTDKKGQVILKKVETGDVSNPWAETQYVYDEYGNLRVVLPPEANKAIVGGNLNLVPAGYSLIGTDYTVTAANYTGGSYMYADGASVTVDPGVTLDPGAEIVPFTIAGDFLSQWAFQYKYDDRNRMVEKRVPGSGWVYMVYDGLDRLIVTQDENQRQGNVEFTFTKYDVYGRPIMTGISSLPYVVDQAMLQNLINMRLALISGHETIGGPIHGYTNINAFPQNIGEDKVLTVTYYDDYNNLPSGFGLPFYAELGNTTNNTNVKGQVVGSKTKVLDGTNTWLKSTVYYDNRYRVVQTVADNSLGGVDRSTSRYDFVGRVLETKTTHDDGTASADIVIAETYAYDHTSRLLEATHQVNSDPAITMVKNEYNSLGELIDKKLHSTDGGANFEQSVDYRYNIRGWLERINDADLSDNENDYFGMELAYNNSLSGITSTAMFNGNISAAKWSNIASGGQKQSAYAYSYDKMNRLTGADYREKESAWADKTTFDVNTLTYDLNGNIESLKRFATNTTLAMDHLNYSYVGNQLQAVTDSGDATEGFKDGNISGNDYAYDENGNMISDANKDITSISYNHLNLPETVTFTGGRSITYTYDAAGIKLSKSTNDNGTTKVTDYVGGFIYEDDVLQQIASAEGRIRRKDNGDFVYDYYLKDHLGNSRVTFTTENEEVIYLATMETDVSGPTDFKAFEESLFLNLPNTRDSSITAANHSGVPLINNNESARLRGTDANRQIGPGKLMQVMPGDSVAMEAFAYHTGSYTDNGSITNTNVLATIISTVTGAAPTGTEGSVIQSAVNANSAAIFVGGNGSSSSPRAYLNYILFDQDFNYLDAGFTQVSGTSGTHVALNSSKTIAEKGYIYVYVSNESNTNFDVFFDDLRITHTKGRILQEDHYYPFGMNINALSSTAPLSKPNQFKYNGFELETSFDLGWYDYQARQYDPQLGRFTSVDPAADLMRRHSPYNYAFDNPIRFIDPDGMMPEDKVEGDPNPDTITQGSITISHNADTGIHTISQSQTETSETFDENGELLARVEVTTVTSVQVDSKGKLITTYDKTGDVNDIKKGYAVTVDKSIRTTVKKGRGYSVYNSTLPQEEKSRGVGGLLQDSQQFFHAAVNAEQSVRKTGRNQFQNERSRRKDRIKIGIAVFEEFVLQKIMKWPIPLPVFVPPNPHKEMPPSEKKG